MRNILTESRYKYFLICLFLLGMTGLFGQGSPDLSSFKPKQLKKLALRCVSRGDYYTALEFMEEYNRKINDDPSSLYLLGELYRKSKQYDSAIVYYSNDLVLKDEKYQLSKYHLGTLKMITMEYDEAKELFDDFRRGYKDHKDSKVYRKLARYHIEGCDTALSTDTSDITAYIYNLGVNVNTEHIEFSPFPLSRDKIIFGSLPIDSANAFSYTKNNAPVRKLYVAEKQGKTWYTMGEPEIELNHPDYSTGNATISPDGNRIYFTRCFKNWKYKNVCEIYLVKKDSGVWGEPVRLNNEINMENYTSTHPTVGVSPKDGADILYFVSDRPGGKGGYDIWYSMYHQRKKYFKTPKNLGSRINTVGNEITPYCNVATQTLYYSSNALPGFGGYDIFKSTGWGRKWDYSQNIGHPVNSSYNDTYLALNSDGNSGFFTTNRPGSQLLESNTCCDDIYFFNWKLPQTIPSYGTVTHNSSGEIIEKLNERFNANIENIPDGTPLDGVSVYLYQKRNDGETILIQTTETKNGKYQFDLERDKDYIVSIKNYGYFDKVVNTTTKRYLSEDTLVVEEASITHVPELTLSFNIYYELDKAKLKPEDEVLLDTTVVYLLELLPYAIIEIGSHTDNLGKEDYNLKLSQRRSESVVNYLIQEGIDSDRLVAKGYGMSQPIAPNQNPDGTDNPEGRQKNRRSQVKIVGALIPTEYIEE